MFTQIVALLTKTTAAQNQVALSYHSAQVIFPGSCFCGDYNIYDTVR